MDFSRQEVNDEVEVPSYSYSLGDDHFLIRVMTSAEVEETFYNLIDKEHWNTTLAKIKAVREVFPSSTLVTIKRETNEIIAVVTVIPTHPGHFIVGNVVVRQDHRQHGHATRMLNSVKAKHAQDKLTLTAVPGVDTFYSKVGFTATVPTHHVYFMLIDRAKVESAFNKSSSSTSISNHDDIIIKSNTNTVAATEEVQVQRYTDDMFPALNAYDTVARGYDCGRYLSVMARTSSLFLVAKSTTSGHVVGYAAAVDESDLMWVDGMYADTDSIALHIFSALLAAFPHKTEVRVQTIKPREFLVGFGIILPKSVTYTRMVIGGTPSDVALSKLYAVADCGYSE